MKNILLCKFTVKHLRFACYMIRNKARIEFIYLPIVTSRYSFSQPNG